MSRGLALVALALAGCVSVPPVQDRTDLIRRILGSTVQLRSQREGGARRAASGVVVATDPVARRAWIVTVRHFVDPPISHMTLEDVKRWYVNKVLEESGGNKLRAAELLDIDRRTLYRILERQATEDEE